MFWDFHKVQYTKTGKSTIFCSLTGMLLNLEESWIINHHKQIFKEGLNSVWYGIVMKTNLVCTTQILKSFLCFRVLLVFIGMPLHRQFSVCPLDLVLACISWDAQDCIKIPPDDTQNILKKTADGKKNYIKEIRKSTIYPAKICMQQDKTRAEIKYTCKSAILPADLTEGKWHRILGMLLLIYPMKTCPSTVVLRDCVT